MSVWACPLSFIYIEEYQLLGILHHIITYIAYYLVTLWNKYK